MAISLNYKVLMSGIEFFDDGQAINPFMGTGSKIDLNLARQEHSAIKTALESAGVEVVTVPAPNLCQDGVYTANWALVRGDKAVMARLPNARQAEEPYAEATLDALGKSIIHLPENSKFSGQGDALTCGDYLFCGSHIPL